MPKRSLYLLLVFIFLMSACNKNEELAGKKFNLAYTPVLQEDIEKPNAYDSLIKLTFSEDHTVNNTISELNGSYELKNSQLSLYFNNENENLVINISLEKSDKDFSEYSALITDVKYEIENEDELALLKDLFFDLQKDRPMEFIIE
ncbi:MAG TPA: hypothetical protein VFF20_07295 [Pseudogracilibacillus sp.]|nr:hypothetical protein [Pseudogracilibacillus sp.]